MCFYLVSIFKSSEAYARKYPDILFDNMLHIKQETKESD